MIVPILAAVLAVNIVVPFMAGVAVAFGRRYRAGRR